jgi:hypothetical protein
MEAMLERIASLEDQRQAPSDSGAPLASLAAQEPFQEAPPPPLPPHSPKPSLDSDFAEDCKMKAEPMLKAVPGNGSADNPSTLEVQEVITRLANLERDLNEVKKLVVPKLSASISPDSQTATSQDLPNGLDGLSPNILESISHELGSAKARIELELGQAVDEKMKHLEERLGQAIDGKLGERSLEVSSGIAGTGESGSTIAGLLDIEAQVRDFRSSVENQIQNVENRLLALEGTMTDDKPAHDSGDASLSREDLQSEIHAVVERMGNMERMLQEVAASPVFNNQSFLTAAEPHANAEGNLEARAQEMKSNMDSVQSEAMWKELTEHAQAAAVRADALERSLMMRIEKIESSLVNILSHGLSDPGLQRKSSPPEKDDDSFKFGKSIEWLNWRISWLEWATNGEKRSFGRSVDHRAVWPSHLTGDPPPTYTRIAASFSQPVTEDMELWARDPRTGVQRLRRNLRPQPQGFADTSNGPHGPLRSSASLGRLPRLGV